MPRRRVLTWQPGASGRSGRWRKKYRGQVLYFPYGSSKSDESGYQQAIAEWQKRKAEIDAEEALAIRPHQEQLNRAIDDWTTVLAWAIEHSDSNMADMARTKISALQARISASKLGPLTAADTVDALYRRSFDPGPITLAPLPESTDMPDGSNTTDEPTRAQPLLYQIPQNVLDLMDGSPERIQAEVWKDRLAQQKRKSQQLGDQLGTLVDQFLTNKRRLVDLKKLSAGRCDVLRVQLEHFRDWAGQHSSARSINARLVNEYHAKLLGEVVDNRRSEAYAKDIWAAFKQFVRWLWQNEILEQLPRNLDSTELRIARHVVTPEVFTLEEITMLLCKATDRTKLYMLLMLNCGMTQKDISDLRVDEVDWERGTITRKRSKTAKHQGVPTVTYPLWNETRLLLHQERAEQGQYALCNEQGGRLKCESLSESGALQKIDNISSAFSRLQRTTKIRKPPKLFRKTAASLINSNSKYASVAQLFLGHAPQSVAERHYLQPDLALLHAAIAWLAGQLKVDG